MEMALKPGNILKKVENFTCIVGIESI